MARDSFYVQMGIWSGCLIAARASRRLRWQYAVSKYAFSCSLVPLELVDLHTRYGEFLPLSHLPEAHIRYAHAILAAHSVIEDLGLEVRASASKPSRVNGQWNPLVKQDLEERLRSAGIDACEPILWNVRGPQRRIDARRPVVSRGKQPWARGSVRDCEVALIDAIAHVDWLRDKVASHGKNRLTSALSAYDVSNAQHLARRLALESLGHWAGSLPSNKAYLHPARPSAGST